MTNGIINIYKPKGITSFDVIKYVRKITNQKKVGHTGTLDPLAYGVLPVCVGKATKIIQYLQNTDKVYIAKIRLGMTTDTYDREGQVLTDIAIDNLDFCKIKNEIQKFVGNIDQVPPMYSALKINGKRLYEYARQNIEIERKARKVTIFSIDILNIDLPFVEIKVNCSKGTYIRSLCYEIGQNLQCGACLWSLERISVGKFKKEESIELKNLNNENYHQKINTIEMALSDFESVYFDEEYENKLKNGVKLYNEKILQNLNENQLYKVYCKENFLGIGKKDDTCFKIVKLLL